MRMNLRACWLVRVSVGGGSEGAIGDIFREMGGKFMGLGAICVISYGLLGTS